MAAPMENKKTQELLTDVHSGLTSLGAKTHLVRGKYFYYHYICDGLDDRGWGCGYRTLQSLCSWVKLQKQKYKGDKTSSKDIPSVPSIPEIQNALVTMGDKPESFINSKEWIGSFEVCLCLDYFYDVPCKILHINSGKEILSHMETITNHFKQFGSPIMMGGESDTSSKGILGICEDPPALLVMDPHYHGPTESVDYLQQHGWIKWRLVEDFINESFYNMCLPQFKCSELG